MTVHTQTHRYLVVIEGDGTTNYSAYSPDVPGCVAVGDTPEECETDMRAALAFHLEGLALAGEPLGGALEHDLALAAGAQIE